MTTQMCSAKGGRFLFERRNNNFIMSIIDVFQLKLSMRYTSADRVYHIELKSANKHKWPFKSSIKCHY